MMIFSQTHHGGMIFPSLIPPLFLSFLLLLLQSSNSFTHHHVAAATTKETHNSPKRYSSLTHNPDSLYAYFETPLPDDDVGHIGPSAWKNLFRVPDNKCGGGGQKDGFGQSPVAIPYAVTLDQCYDIQSYQVKERATCTVQDLTFQIQKNGLSAMVKDSNADTANGGASTSRHRNMGESSSSSSSSHEEDEHKYEPICHLGSVETPDGQTYKAVEILIKPGAEHFFEGEQSKAEMQIFHIPTSNDDSTSSTRTPSEKMVFSYLFHIIDPSDVDDVDDWSNLCLASNAFYEVLLHGFEQVANETRTYCSDHTEGSQLFNSDTVLRSQQELIICGDVQDELANYDYVCPNEEYYSYYDLSFKGPIPDIYSLSYKNISNLYYYKGSLTAPPCTENVHWNIVGTDTLFLISFDQWARTTILNNCRVEPSTCRFASASSEFGVTSRPPQKLGGRNIIKYCDGTSSNVISASNNPDLSAPELKAYKIPKAPKTYYALLFPWFATALGLGIFYILTRSFLHVLPYTAVMFALGTIMGAIITFRSGANDQLSDSTRMWENINSELLLLTFLPGLLFKDAYGLDIHLFQKSLLQITIMGFPMVLVGSLLMSLVGMYILPYDWSFSLSMTFGAIVSATDPVAVSSLLNELGAPPRLKMHISGESLLNDGSAIVFFTIFKNIFLYEQGIHGGKDYSIGEGIEIFAKMSLGAVAIGIAFGLGLVVVLFLLNRRFNHEESIVQVTATIATAYLCYYVAEAILHMSGVLAVVICGAVTKAFASSLINDPEMMHSFWNLVEHLLNTVLFLLGGLVWGSVISNQDKSRPEMFSSTDWGYLFVVFLLMSVVRCFLFGLFYPILSRIGLKSNWKETVFQSFGGLRGAVGIALAIALDNEVIHETVRIDPRRVFTSQLFGITGGISLLTLFVNGVLAGPLLKKLKLGRASVERKEIVEQYHQKMKKVALENLVKLLANERFKHVDSEIIRHHLPDLEDITCGEIDLAVRRVKDTTPVHRYSEPNLHIFEYYYKKENRDFSKLKRKAQVKFGEVFHDAVMRVAPESFQTEDSWSDDETPSLSKGKTQELRLVCLELLKTQYHHDIKAGYINSRYGDIDFELLKSVALSEDEVSQGAVIQTWKHCGGFIRKVAAKWTPGANSLVISRVLLTSAFIQAHKETMNVFRDSFGEYRFLTEKERQVIDECSHQVDIALKSIEEEDQVMVNQILSHQLCTMILNQMAIVVSNYVERGLLKDIEAEHLYEEIEHHLNEVENSLHNL